MKIMQKTQNNGLETIFVNSVGSTLGSVQIWFRAGSALENKSNEGIAHFLEHMFFKGTQKRPGAKIASDVESFGGEINAFTSFDYTCYYINCPDDKIIESTDILLDMVSNPRFLQKELEPEREVVFEEYRRSIDSPNQYSFSQIQKNSFCGQYSHPILGREATIKNFSRKQLNDFRKENYNNQNAFLVVAGDLNTDLKLIKKLESKINQFKLPNGQTSSFPKFKIKDTNKHAIHLKDVEMAQITFCFQAPHSDTTQAAHEDLALNCLGHGRSSILYKKLVLEDTIANSCSASSMFMRDGGVHFIRISSPVSNMQKSLKILLKTLKQISTQGLEKEEIQKIKNQYIASKTYDQESLENYSFSKGHSYASTLELNSEDKFIDSISSATPLETNTALQNLLNQNIQISVQMPLEEKENLKSWNIYFKSFIEEFRSKFKTNKSISSTEIKYKFNQSSYDPQAKLFQLNKQVQLFYKKNDSAPTFVLHAYLQGGLTLETAKNNGIHNQIGLMLSNGYKDVTYEQLQQDLDFKAAYMSGFAGKNAYGLTSHGLTVHFNEISSHIVKSLFEPSFDQDQFTHEKELTLRSLEISKKDPIKQCFTKVSDIFFNQHPYSLEMLGSEKNISNFTVKNLKDIHQNNLKNGKIIFSYSGNLSYQEVIKRINTLIKGYKTNQPKLNLKKNKLLPQKNITEHIPFDREQTQIFIGFSSAPMRSEEHLYLKILSSYLGGQSSPLFVDVRDKKGLCYSAQPIHFTALEAGYWGIYMASGHDKVEKAKNAIYQLLGSIQKKGFSKSNFIKIKKQILGSQKLQLQTNSDFINFYSINSLHGLGIDFFHKQLKEVDKLTYEKFQLNIKKILSRPMSIVTVGK